MRTALQNLLGRMTWAAAVATLALVVASPAAGLPDGRVYELVSPPRVGKTWMSMCRRRLKV